MSGNRDGNNKKPPVVKTATSYNLLLKGMSTMKPKPSPKKNPAKNSDASKNNTNKEKNDTVDNSQNAPSTSADKKEQQQDPDIPDRSYGDYYCKLCDSHMNSDNMWEAHITGKRHIKNVTKGDTETKYDDLPDVESSVKYEVQDVKDPIVGLSYIHEIRRKEKDVPPIYNCFLCHASIATVPLVIEHVTSLKHRLNYIKEKDPDEYQLIEATNLSKGLMEPVVMETAKKLEDKFGRGTVKVKQEKQKKPVHTYSSRKASSLIEEDDAYRKPFKNSRDDNNMGLWKSVDTGNSFGRRERSPSPAYFDDRFMSPSRSISPRKFRERKRRYSDDDLSVEGYKQGFPKRSISPLRREPSPLYDYEIPRSMDYRHSSRKGDSYDRMGRISPLYEPMRQEMPVKRTFDSHNSLHSASSLGRFVVDQSRNLTTDQPKTVAEILEDLSRLPSEDCYNLFYLRLKALPEVSSVNELLGLTKLLNEAKRKLTEEVLNAIPNYDKSSSNIIPGLGEMTSSSAQFNVRNENTSKLNNSSANFLSELFKTANPALSKVSSYTPAVNSQLSNFRSTDQTSSANYQAASVSPYQAPSNNYSSQPPYQQQNSNVPYASGSVQTFPPNVAPYISADKGPSQNRIYNYSHYSSSTSGSKNFPYKF